MASAVEVRGLSKHYGHVRALDGLDLDVQEGEVFGLLGRNGAGKTTLLKVLLGLCRPSAGEARLLGHPAGSVDARRHVGYLPEGHEFPAYHTAYSALDFYATLSGVPSAERRRRIPQMLEMVGLADWARAKVRTFSKGMKQRLGIANALLHEPKIVFLDEPTEGIDPVGRRDIRNLLVALQQRGVTIFLNSHLLSEVERVCTRVSILERGRVVREGSLEELTAARNRFSLQVRGDLERVAQELERRFGARIAGDQVEVTLAQEAEIDAVVDLLRANAISIRELTMVRATLEDVFVSAVGGQRQSGGAVG